MQKEEKAKLMSDQAKTLKKYLTIDSRAKSIDPPTGLGPSIFTPLLKSYVDFEMTWKREEQIFSINIEQLYCEFSKTAKLAKRILVKIQVLRNASMLENIINVFQKEDQIMSNLAKEKTTSVKKRKKETTFNEQFDFSIPIQCLEDYMLRLLLCTLDTKDGSMDTMGESVIPLRQLDSSILYSTRATLKCVPKASRGEVLLSLSYLPTSEKLSVAIIEVNNIKPLKEGKSGTVE